MARKNQEEDPSMRMKNVPVEDVEDDGEEYLESIAEALLQAQQTLLSVGKESTNAFHKYKYASAETMFAACREALHESGLLVRRISWTIDVGSDVLTSVFEIAQPSTGQRETCTTQWFIVEDKGRPKDKALGGALTTSFSYFLRDLLLLPREEETARRQEDEMDRRDDTEHTPVLGVVGAAALKKWLVEKEIAVEGLFDFLSKQGFKGKDLAMVPTSLKPKIAAWGKAILASGIETDD